jgi:hypothetical protein
MKQSDKSCITEMKYIHKYCGLHALIPLCTVLLPTTRFIPSIPSPFSLRTPSPRIHDPIPQTFPHRLLAHKSTLTTCRIPRSPLSISSSWQIRVDTKISLHDHLLFIQHLCYSSPVPVHDDACFVQRMLDGFLCVEDVADLLEGAAPSFDEEEVNNNEFEHVPEYE